jgi:hypothetical protein
MLTRIAADGILDGPDLEEEAHLTVDVLESHPAVRNADLYEITRLHNLPPAPIIRRDGWVARDRSLAWDALADPVIFIAPVVRTGRLRSKRPCGVEDGILGDVIQHHLKLLGDCSGRVLFVYVSIGLDRFLGAGEDLEWVGVVVELTDPVDLVSTVPGSILDNAVTPFHVCL